MKQRVLEVIAAGLAAPRGHRGCLPMGFPSEQWVWGVSSSTACLGTEAGRRCARGRAVSFQSGQTRGADHSPCSVEPEGGFYKANPSEGPPVYLGRSTKVFCQLSTSIPRMLLEGEVEELQPPETQTLCGCACVCN